MTNDELRALADALDRLKFRCDGIDDACLVEDAADYLRACADAKPVAWLRPENRVEEECTARTRISIGERCPPIGTWRPLYTHPAPAAPQAEPCIGNDPICPCQDGDACHYKDSADGTKAWPVPQSEPKRKPACLWSRADDDTDVWETRCGHAFTIIDGTPGDNHMEFCCYCGRPLEQEIGGSDAE